MEARGRWTSVARELFETHLDRGEEMTQYRNDAGWSVEQFVHLLKTQRAAEMTSFEQGHHEAAELPRRFPISVSTSFDQAVIDHLREKREWRMLRCIYYGA